MLDVQIDGGAGSGVGAWARVGVVTLGIFTVMTAELLPVGLLTPVAAELEVSAGTAGLMVTVPGLVAAVSAPLIALRAAGADRRTVLVLLMALVAAANLATATAGHFAVVLGARVLLGIAIGGFWALAGGLAPRLVPAAGVGRATAVIFGGVSAASVLGVPAATTAAEWTGWRGAFAGVGVVAVLATAGLLALLPRLPGERRAPGRRAAPGLRPGLGPRPSSGPRPGPGLRPGLGLRTASGPRSASGLRPIPGRRTASGPRPGPGLRTGLGALLRLPRENVRVRTGLLLTLLLVTGHFLAYSFVRPVLAEHSHVSEDLVGMLLLGYGVAGVAGNFLAGPAAGRSPRRTLAVISAGLTAALLAFALAGVTTPAGAGLLLLWGLAYGGVSVGLQSWFMAAAPEDVETATGLYVSVFCLSIALGALLGGLLVDATTLVAVLCSGAALTLAACLAAVRPGRTHLS
ncbi:MFS transporter [Streptomyces sp. NPDC003035]|uniref:MFS transporter n=1 Tax=Streptomyces sp. NPDC003035 TaxID=3364676 RepID=UPI0036C14A84